MTGRPLKRYTRSKEQGGSGGETHKEKMTFQKSFFDNLVFPMIVISLSLSLSFLSGNKIVMTILVSGHRVKCPHLGAHGAV